MSIDTSKNIINTVSSYLGTPLAEVIDSSKIAQDFVVKLLMNIVQEQEQAQAKKESFKGEFIQLGPKFTDKMSITLNRVPTLLESQILQKVDAVVQKTSQKFDFHKNGFEFLDFNGSPLATAIESLANGPTSWPDIPAKTISDHASAVENALSDWGKGQGLKFSQVVWIDTVYRNTAGGKFGAVHFAHVDFPSNDHSCTLKGHADWKDRVVKKLGDMTTEAYENLSISKIVNIWMPLDKQIEAEPLAMMDLQTLGDADTHLRIYEDQRATGGDKYFSVGVMPSEQHRWYIKKDMKLGEAVVFDSCKTPHSAVSLPDQGSKTRRSVECRALFLKQ
jgi:hypothetical protein